MTDNRTTELLPCPHCRGEAFVNAKYEFRWCECRDCGAEGKTCLTEAEAIEAWNTRVTHGTLTAEQVEKAIHDCSTYASYDGCTYYASGIKLQAIADELNAELGSQREKELEQLVRDMYDVAARGEFDVGEESKFSERMVKLGVVSEC